MKIGIIGGSGLDDPKILSDFFEKEIITPFGNPSSKITCGKISGAEVFILSRHGKNHDIPPSQVNFRANIYTLKSLGCDFILATTAVGSLREEILPGNLVFPDQFIDFTKQRKMTFFDSIGEVKHAPMAEPFDKRLRNLLSDVCEDLGFSYNKNKTVVCIEGPRFSSKAESNMFRQIGADIINMSTCPEVILANEIGIPYQSIAMSTDYDCWKDDTEHVTWEMIQKIMHENSEKVKKLLVKAIERLMNSDTNYLKNKIRTIPNWPKDGIMFRDITTLLSDAEGMKKVSEIFYNRYKNSDIDVVCGIESRGFVFGTMIANRLGKGFVPIRKPGKLPFKTIKEDYELEYGSNTIEIHEDAISSGNNVLIVDDLIATGGTLIAACNLIEKLGGRVYECAAVIDLPELNGSKKINNLGYKVFTILDFEGE